MKHIAPPALEVTTAQLLPYGRKVLEEYKINGKRLWEVNADNLAKGKPFEVITKLQQYDQTADALCLMIAMDVNNYNDGNLSRIACNTHLPVIAEALGMSAEITKDHPLVNLVQEIRDSMHHERNELLGLPPIEPSIKIDAVAVANRARSCGRGV
jgi:hypothetical protein